MTYGTQSGMQRQRERQPVQRVITRHNGPIFYGMTVASFLETAVPQHVNTLLGIFASDPETAHWLEQVWWPAKSLHARETRAYVEAMWPEFDWSAAYDGFYEAYRQLPRPHPARRSLAYVALARCTVVAQTAAFYRGLAGIADDPALRRLLERMSGDEAAHFDRFRRVFERHGRRERLGLLATYRAIAACSARARDVDVRLAFSGLHAHWYNGAPFPELGYRDFVLRMSGILRRHLPFGFAQRLLFRPWLRPSQLPPEPSPGERPASRSAPRAQFAGACSM